MTAPDVATYSKVLGVKSSLGARLGRCRALDVNWVSCPEELEQVIYGMTFPALSGGNDGGG
ncbi:hypothetical protein [Arthrobacter sp. StoSoilA2]|uniref:hypothetical protein n=1 Tax=Arthrobacter sp. StoSoilA2 TaxID=2830990 RepID=UPI001CC73F18|nr:hypothetical protein [Arthrobacter sp. StoSoilA2]